MADCQDCTGTCSTTCTGKCTGKCGTSCSNNCSGTCDSTCSGKCYGSCKSGCTNDCVQDCSNTCKTTCTGNCYTTCNTTCFETCKDKCKGYCASICQTYCEKQQVFSKNLSPIANAIGKPAFSWKYNVAENNTIQITASEWNLLKSYIKVATSYCGGTAPSLADVKTNDFITASQYNDLAKGLGLTSVTADETFITTKNIDALRTTYNGRKITDTLPIGKNPLTGGQNQCCQSGQTCMAEGQLLSHQGKTAACKDQTASSCGDQTANH